MFGILAVGVDNHDAGRDTIELAKQLVSDRGEVSLVYVDVIHPRPAPDSDVSSVEARSVRGGLHEFAASQAADLLVVGSHRHRRFDRLVEWSTSQRLADDVSCPLLVLSSSRAAG